MICTADRENGRVLCFDTDGKFVRNLQPEGFGGRIFGISYAKEQLYAVSGPEFNPFAPKPVGYILDIESGNIDGTFQVWYKNNLDVVGKQIEFCGFLFELFCVKDNRLESRIIKSFIFCTTNMLLIQIKKIILSC